ncbi:MAG: hypothetical protein ACE37F_17110 [Nannocystaceae bacterium]|nr:hypothetical protein [bacterium]
MRTALFGLLVASSVLVACGDDGASEGSSSGQGSTSATLGSSSSTSSGSTSVDFGSTSSSSAGSSEGSSSETTGEGSSGRSEGSSSSGGTPSTVILQNDAWIDNTATAVQGGFDAGECWASTYVPAPEHYPFRLESFQVLIAGDEEDVTRPFEVSVWTVDDDLMPVTQMVNVTGEFTATSRAFNLAVFDTLAVPEIVIDEGNFAIAMCLAEHDGFPAIAADVGAEIVADRNWLYTGGAWGQSAGFGLAGNWIMRAVIVPQ